MQETAPLYDNVRQVQDFPRLAGCVAASDSCTCYTQQASPLTAISQAECRAIVENRPFDPYRPQRQDTAAAVATAAPPSGSVYTLAAQHGHPLPRCSQHGTVAKAAPGRFFSVSASRNASKSRVRTEAAAKRRKRSFRSLNG